MSDRPEETRRPLPRNVLDRVLHSIAGTDVSMTPDEVREAMANPENCFDPYVEVGTIGRGGMGEVVKAWDRDLKRWVAVKSLQLDSPAAVRRFEKEAQVVARLSHPNIVSVYGLTRRKGQPCFVMQYVEGSDAGHTPVSFQEAARIVQQAAGALHYAHQQGVVHRDLKPANLLLDRQGRVFVTDFGLAREADRSSGMTSCGRVLGTPSYMSPEQARGETDRIGLSTDIFGLGATLYQLCTGRPPYVGDTSMDTLLHAIRGEFPPPRTLRPDLPGALERICLTAMASDPAKRYPSAEALAVDLNRWRTGKSTGEGRVRKRAGWMVGAAAALLSTIALGIWIRSLTGTVRDAVEAGSLIASRPPSASIHPLEQSMEAELRRLDQLHSQPVRPSESVAGAVLGAIERILTTESTSASPPSLVPALRGWALCNLGRVQEGEKELERAVAAGGLEKRDPYGVIFRTRWEARKRYSRMSPELFEACSIPTEEIAAVARWSGWEAENPYSLLSRGLAVLAKGQFKEAAVALETWPEPWKAEGLMLATVAWFRTGDLERARRSANVARALRPDWVHVGVWVTGTFLGKVDIQGEKAFKELGVLLGIAEEECASWLKGHPDDLEARLSLGLLRVARVETNPRSEPEAKEILLSALQDHDAVLARRSSDDSARYNRAWAYRRVAGRMLGRDAAAYATRSIADYTAILGRHPDSIAALLQRGWLHLRVGSLTEALTDFQAANRGNPSLWMPYAARGEVLERLGRPKEALSAYESARSRMEVASDEDRNRLNRTIQALKEQLRTP